MPNLLLWKASKNLLNSKAHKHPIKKSDDTLAKNKTEKANTLAEYYEESFIYNAKTIVLLHLIFQLPNNFGNYYIRPVKSVASS